MVNEVQEKAHSLESGNSITHRIGTFNNVSSKGLDIFPIDRYSVGSDSTGCDAYVLRSQKLHDVDIPNTVKAIGRAGAGVNNIPVDRCTDNGVVVFNSPGANANAVKELVLAGMLLSSRDIVGGINYVSSIADEGESIPQLVEKNKSRYKGTELTGKTLGVVGLGAIGLQVANVGLSMGMRVLGHDPFISVTAAWELSSRVERANSLDALLRESDYITVHIPFREETKRFIHSDRIRIMKKGAVLLNFSRNELVDENAMVMALKAGDMSRYVTDFPNPVLCGVDRVISIPHLGASTEEAEDNCAIMVCNQIRDFLENGNITHSVNFPDSQMAFSTPFRLTIVNKNVPNCIGLITSIIADAGINISEMVNKSKGAIAYNMIDMDQDMPDSIVQQLLDLDDVIRVRKLTQKS